MYPIQLSPGSRTPSQCPQGIHTMLAIHAHNRTLKGPHILLLVFYHEKVIPAMEALRAPVDRLEMIVDKDMWPMPSYGDLLFEV